MENEVNENVNESMTAVEQEEVVEDEVLNEESDTAGEICPKIWKISMGEFINKDYGDTFDELYNNCEVAVHRNAGNKGKDGRDFEESICDGDFFYLCVSGSYEGCVKCFGQFIGDALAVEINGNKDWLKRRYKRIKEAISDEPYYRPDRKRSHYSPSGMRTVYEIRLNEMVDFQADIMTPYFGLELEKFMPGCLSTTSRTIDGHSSADTGVIASNVTCNSQSIGCNLEESKTLICSKNIILHGAPGTGKTFLAKQIAADIVSGGMRNYDDLSDEEKKQIGFVQFHPSYDYVDFVEGLRPVDEGQVNFKLMPGVFKSFVDDARENKENYDKSNQNPEVLSEELDARSVISGVLSEALENNTEYSTKRSKFNIEEYSASKIVVRIPKNVVSDLVTLSVDDLTKLVVSDSTFNNAKDVSDYFERNNGSQADSYYSALWVAIKSKYSELRKRKSESYKSGGDIIVPLKNYVFIIDEINRGDISKIFGELFFSIDPGYRGPKGEVSTQYANLHKEGERKFYIPDNVYIIGTMNDIDRSVDSFDFAMRRRFRFVEIKVSFEK